MIAHSYCDAIAHCLSKLLQATLSGAIQIDLDDAERVIKATGPVKLDLGQDGEYRSSKKQFSVADVNGKIYRVTVEEVE